MGSFMEVFMYERMLDKQAAPAIEEMIKFCGENSERVKNNFEKAEKNFEEIVLDKHLYFCL